MYVNNFPSDAATSPNPSQDTCETVSESDNPFTDRLGVTANANELASLIEHQILQNEDDESLGLSVFMADAIFKGDDLASQLPDTYYYSSIYYPPQKIAKGLLLKLPKDEFHVAQTELLKRGVLRPSLKSASGFVTYRYIKALSERRVSS